MKKISSENTTIMKKALPIGWFLFLAQIMVNWPSKINLEGTYIFIFASVAMTIIGYFIFEIINRNLMDEVFDNGSHLIARYRGEEDLVYLTNIKNISWDRKFEVQRVVVQLNDPGKFGTEFYFIPAYDFTFYLTFKAPKNKIVDDLQKRILHK